MDGILITNKELAAHLGIDPQDVRTFKSQNSSQFTQSIDWDYGDGNVTYWSESGVEKFTTLYNAVKNPHTDVKPCEESIQANLDYLETQIAQMLADDAEPQLEVKLDSDRITRKALNILAQRFAAKLRQSHLEHWQLVTEHLHITPDGVAGNLPACEEVITHA